MLGEYRKKELSSGKLYGITLFFDSGMFVNFGLNLNVIPSEMEISKIKLDPNFRKIISIREYHGNDIEQKALELYQCLLTISKSDEKYLYLYLRITYPNGRLGNSRRGNVGIKLPRNFLIILLSSLRHLKLYDQPQKFPMRSLIHVIVEDLLRNLDYLDFRSLYLLKVLDQVVLKKLDLISDMHELLLAKLYEVCYASPIPSLKNFAVTLIHKIEMTIGNGVKNFDPMKNIGVITNYEDTRIKLALISTEGIHTNLQDYMKFVHKYFHFNVYNKAAGILYRAVISRYNMDDFKTHIWPFWCESFEKHGESREFRQSFFKYWIPFTVQEYNIDLYTFFRDRNVSKKLLVEIQFELRRKKHISIKDLSEGIFLGDLIEFMENYETNIRAYEILCTFPSLNETLPIKCLETFEKYLLGHKLPNHCIENFTGQFLAHIFVTGHVIIEKNLNNFIYDAFLKKLRDFIVDSFEEEKNLDLALELCKILCGIKRSCKDLKLKYEVPKKYQYGPEQNKYFTYLQENGILDIFTEKKDFITRKLIKIFNENDSSNETSMWLLKNAFDDFEVDDLNLASSREGRFCISLQNLEKYLDSQRLSLNKTAKNRDKTELVLSFVMVEHQIVLALLNTKITNETADELFDILQIMNVLVLANQMGITTECQSTSITSMLGFMVGTVEGSLHENLTPKARKLLEHLFCKILEIIRLAPTTLKAHSALILQKLVVVIEKSNMRKVVTEVLNLVPHLSEMMASFSCKSRKSLDKFYKELLDAIVSPGSLKHLQKSRMRKHPRLRSLLHAVCKGSGAKQREFVVEAVRKMTWKLTQHNLNPTVHTVLLECLEIMIVEPNFHNYTSSFLEEAIILSLNSFQSDNWSVKNAAIQLTNTLITRIYGVQQTENIRLRSFQEFCVLFPRLSDHFYNILSSPQLDDRALIVLQYLSASEVLVYEHSNEKTKKIIQKFLELLKRLLESQENYIIKYVPHAFVNLCEETTYESRMREAFNFVALNLKKKPSNVIVNHLILFKEFVRKLNEGFFFLKPMKIEMEPSLIQVVNEMNEFLKDKDLQYLDLHNIRHFVLDRYSESFIDIGNSNVTLKFWNLCNTLRNFPSGYITTNFLQLFDVISKNKELNFLLELFLDQIVSHAIEKKDLDLFQMIFNKLTTEIFNSKTGEDKNFLRNIIKSILELSDFFEHIEMDCKICKDIEEMNFYQAVMVQIILSEKKCCNKSALCKKSFEKLTQFRNIDNLELQIVPKLLYFIHENLGVLDNYLFMKLLLYLLLTDCDKEDICEFLTDLCGKFTNEDNCICNLFTYEFLYEYFKDDEDIKRFLVDALKMIEKFENKARFDTFYMDTYRSLQKTKNFINKMKSKIS